MYKNIVFDFGQVLVKFDEAYMTRQYIKDENDAKLVQEVVFDRLYWDKLDAGTITDEEVMAGSRARLPERLWEDAEKVYFNWIYNIPEIPGMREILVKLKAEGKRLYLLSNICTYFAEHADEIPILKLLDGCVYSAVAGNVKPHREIFDHLCAKFSLDPAETIFVDDREVNIRGAENAGIAGYLFDGDAAKLWAYLEEHAL